MKPKLTKPEPAATVLARLISASLAAGNATQSAEVVWGGWRVCAYRERGGMLDVLVRGPGFRRWTQFEARSVPAVARKIAEAA